MSTPGFNYIFENITGMACPLADYAALSGNDDDASLVTKFFRARQYRLVYSLSLSDGSSTSGDVTLAFNSGDQYSANQDPWQRYQMTSYLPYHDDGASQSDTNAPFITNADSSIDTAGAMFAMNIAQFGTGVFKFLPWMQIVLGNFSDPAVIASRYQPVFESYVQFDTVSILGLTIPVWTIDPGIIASFSMQVDDSVTNAYWDYFDPQLP